MAAGDRIITSGIVQGQLIPQEGATFTETEFGWDEGVRKFLTHPGTSKSAWPQRNSPDAEWSKMFVRDVVPRDDESGLKELIVYYRGVMRFTGEKMKVRPIPSAGVSLFSLPGKTGDGKKATYVAPVPKPSASREFLTLTQPTLTGVGSPYSDTWLPAPPAFSLSYTADPDEAQTLNLTIGWVLDNRSWEEISGVFLVREDVGYYYPLAG